MDKKNLAHVEDIVLKAVHAAGFEVDREDIHVERTKTLAHGHFATNIAMGLAGKLDKNPRDIAQKIVEHLKDNIVKKTDIAGPGFINLWLEQNFYTENCQLLSQKLEKYLQESLGFKKGEKVMATDTSHPNVAKPMGVHHLMSTIIGDSLIKLYRALGWKVISDNYIGDWGTQFGKLIYAVKTWGDRKKIEKDPIPELLNLYVKFHNEAEQDPKLEEGGRAEFKKLEDGDKENRKLWKYVVKISLDEFQKIYKRLNVTYDKMDGESFYEDKMPAVLEEGRKKGVFVDGEGGSWIVLPNDPADPPTLVKKSDGATLYMTRDLAQIAYWEKAYHPDRMVWVVDVAQSFHFRQRFHASRKLKQTTAELVHVDFGRMQFKDKKMSTRKGNILKLEEVLDEAVERAFRLAKEKASDVLSEKELKELARIMGIGAIKYNILSQNRVQNITFDWDKMLSFEGNSAPYLMYTAARAKSILRKAGLAVKKASKFELDLKDDLETQVALDLMMYASILQCAAEDYKPNHMANYLYGLAQNYNTLYNNLPVLQAESRKAKETRLLLTAATVTVMEHCLELLGIEVPEKM
ncbi:MAG: arginine--tRNA ligase [Candidatus Peregrinibacteria bacterium]